jgi:hypothetical protein
MFGNSKTKRIEQNEKQLKKLHGNIIMVCSNPECNNALKVTGDDTKRTLQCSKCFKGFLKVKRLKKY